MMGGAPCMRAARRRPAAAAPAPTPLPLPPPPGPAACSSRPATPRARVSVLKSLHWEDEGSARCVHLAEVVLALDVGLGEGAGA
eukprot:1515036-Rhodomonas_salina.2